MKMIIKQIMGIMSVAALSLGLAVAHAQEETQDATLTLSSGSVAAGIGFTWGSGTLTYRGKVYPIDVKGLSIADVGISELETTGKVYNLKNLDDFDGNYMAVEAGVTLGGGGVVSTMKNQNGVRINLVSTTQGVEFTLGTSGVHMKIKQSEVVAVVPSSSAPSKMHFSADELFDFDKAILKHGSRSRDQLDELAIRLKTLTFDTVNVIGYTDRLGSEAHNNSLSLQRAETVKSYLVTQGVDSGKIRTVGKGSADSITGNKCKGHEKTKALVACLQPDRRVIVEVDGTR